MRGDVRDRGSLRGGERCVPRGPDEIAGCGVGMTCCGACFGHRDLAPRPRPSQLQRAAGPRVAGPDRFEERQHVLGTSDSPFREQLMI